VSKDPEQVLGRPVLIDWLHILISIEQEPLVSISQVLGEGAWDLGGYLEILIV
jgi:hypothetical protein